MLSHSVSLTYIYAFISPPPLLKGTWHCCEEQQRLCVHVLLWALGSEWSLWRLSPRWTSSRRACLGWAGPGWAGLPPAGEPLAGCLGSAAPCRLARRVGGGWCSLTGVVPLPSGGRGGNKKSSVTSRLMGRGITARSCNWWCCSHLCAKPSKHTVGGWQGCVGFFTPRA